MAKRRKLSILAGALLALGAATAVWAYFTAIGSGTGSASISTLASPSPVTAAPGVGSAHVTWSSVTSPSGSVGDVTFTVQRSLNGGSYIAASGTCAGTQPNAAPSTTLSCDDSIGTAGSYVYRVTALFRTWTSSGVSSAIVVVVDSTPPTSSITFPTTGGFYNATTYRAGCTAGTDEVCGTAADPGAGATGLNRVQVAIQRSDSLYWNGSAWASGITWNDASGTTSWSYALAAANLTDGSYVVQSRAIDNASNTQTSPASKSFSYDNTAPTSTITFPVDGAFYNNAAYRDGCAVGTYEVCGVASDPGTGPSGLNNVQVAIQRSSDSRYWNGSAYPNGGEWVSGIVWNNATGTANWSYAFLVSGSPYFYSLQTGVSYAVQSRAIDNLGNTQAAPDANSFVFDNSEPSASLTFPNSSTIWNNTSYTAGCAPGTDEICGTASDVGSSVNRVELNIRRGSDSQYWDGSAWVSGVVWLNASGTTIWSYSLSATNLTDGQYFVQLRPVDQAGNPPSILSSQSFAYDNTPPTSAITFPTAGSFYNLAGYRAGCTAGTDEVCGTASDPATWFGALVSKVQVAVQRSSDANYWNGSAWVGGIVWNDASGTTSWSYPLAVANLTDGVTYTVQSRAIDNSAANTQTPPASKSFTYDTAGPTIATVTSSDGDGKLEVGDTIVVTFNEALDPTTVPGTVDVRVIGGNGNGSTPDSISISGVIGQFSTGSLTYMINGNNQTASFASSTTALSNGNKTITVTVAGACTNVLGSGCANLSNGTAQSFSVAPVATIKDVAGNNATGTKSLTSFLFF